MPFKSKSQQRFMFSQHPEMAKEWADATPDISKLPEHVKHMAEGGETMPYEEPGAKDATVMDFLAPYIGGPAMGKAAEALPEISSALGEAGEASLGGAADEAASQTPKVEAYIKGMQQNPSGDAIKIIGVKGEPSEIAKLGFGEEPGSVPEDVLRKFGVEVPHSAPFSQDPSSLSANRLREMWGEVAREQQGTPVDAVGHYTRPDLFVRSEHMAKGGDVVDEKEFEDPVPGPSERLGVYKGSDGKEHAEHVMTAADGGDVPENPQFPAGGQSGDGASNLRAILDMFRTGGMGAMLPGGIGANAIAQGTANAANNATIPQLSSAMNAGLGMNPPQTQPTPQVDQAFMNQMQNAPNGGMQTPPPPQSPSPQAPPSLSQAAQTAQNAPQTSPDIYAGIGAPDRAALAQQLLAQKASPGNMAASGVGGLADAITSAFGKSPTNFQGNIRNAQAQNAQQRLGIMDTERQQKMQDIQAKMAVQESDPNSPFSQGMRQFLQAQGMKVPSGMSAAMLKQTLPDVSKIFESKMLALTQQGAQGVEAGKALMGESLWQQLKDSLGLGENSEKGEAYLAGRIGGGQGGTPNFTHQTPSGIKYGVR